MQPQASLWRNKMAVCLDTLKKRTCILAIDT